MLPPIGLYDNQVSPLPYDERRSIILNLSVWVRVSLSLTYVRNNSFGGRKIVYGGLGVGSYRTSPTDHWDLLSISSSSISMYCKVERHA